MSLEFQRFAVIGTSCKEKIQDPPRLLAANHHTADQAADQCKRFALQGWGCQVMPVLIKAMTPTLEGMK